MSSLSIRRATTSDVQGLAALAAGAFGATFGALYPPEVLASYLAETYSAARTLALIEDPALGVWVADGEGLAGYAVLGPAKLPHPGVTPGCIELRRLYAAPGRTGGGVGSLLMEAVVLPGCAAATGDAWLGVYSENWGAQRFYRRYGFVQMGEYEFPVGPIRDREFILRRMRG